MLLLKAVNSVLSDGRLGLVCHCLQLQQHVASRMSWSCGRKNHFTEVYLLNLLPAFQQTETVEQKKVNV